jgi:hypothetical protein
VLGTFNASRSMTGHSPIHNWLFSNVPPERLESSLRAPQPLIDSACQPLYLPCNQGRTAQGLVDTGADGLAPMTGDLLRNLTSEGITPEEITTVILTHAHPDHVGGVLDTSGKPAFANAQYVMSKTEWDFWTSKPDLRGPGMDDHVIDPRAHRIALHKPGIIGPQQIGRRSHIRHARIKPNILGIWIEANGRLVMEGQSQPDWRRTFTR